MVCAAPAPRQRVKLQRSWLNANLHKLPGAVITTLRSTAAEGLQRGSAQLTHALHARRCDRWLVLRSANLRGSTAQAALRGPSGKVSDMTPSMTPPMTPSHATEQSVQPPSSQGNSSSQVSQGGT